MCTREESIFLNTVYSVCPRLWS